MLGESMGQRAARRFMPREEPRIITDITERHDNAEIQQGRRQLAIRVTSNITNHILNGSCWACGAKDISFSQQLENNGLCENHHHDQA